MGMADTANVKVICYMRNGFESAYGRLPGCPRVPGKPAEVEMHPISAKYLRGDPRVVFLTVAELKDFEAAAQAKAADLKERQADADAERTKAGDDTKPDKPKRDRKPRTRGE